MRFISLLRPDALDVKASTLHQEAMDYALESVRNLGLIEGGIRVRLRQELLQGRTYPAMPALQRAVDSEVRIANNHLFFGGSPEAFLGRCALLAGPTKLPERMESIVRYTIARVIESGMNDDAERGVLFQKREELVTRTVQCMANRIDPLAALQAAVREILSVTRSAPPQTGADPLAGLSKIALTMQGGNTKKVRRKRPWGDEIS